MPPMLLECGATGVTHCETINQANEEYNNHNMSLSLSVGYGSD